MISLSLLQAELLAQHEENCLVLNQMTASVSDVIVFVTGGTAGPASRELFSSESDDCLCQWCHCLCYRQNCWPSMKRIVWFWIRWLPLSMISLSLLQAELLAQHEENCLVLNQMTASVNDLIVFVTGGTAGPAWRELFGPNQMTASVNDVIVFVTGGTAGTAWRELFGTESDDCLCQWSSVPVSQQSTRIYKSHGRF